MQHHLPGHGNARGHVSQAKRHGLVLDQRLAKALALLGIVARHLERGTCHADRLGRNADTPTLKVGQGDLVALPFFAQAIGNGHAHIVENDLTGVRGMLP
ncbi:hypothetical protein D3C79_898190 [compost metagenome]